MSLTTPQPPLLCTGFGGGIALGAVKDLFEWGQTKERKAEEGSESGVIIEEVLSDEDKGNGSDVEVSKEIAEGIPLLTPQDESRKTPGLFLVGPAVQHGKLSFCFVYKYRQRFGIVANAIAEGLGYDTKQIVEECRKMDMYLDDFSCCAAACGETCG